MSQLSEALDKYFANGYPYIPDPDFDDGYISHTTVSKKAETLQKLAEKRALFNAVIQAATEGDPNEILFDKMDDPTTALRQAVLADDPLLVSALLDLGARAKVLTVDILKEFEHNTVSRTRDMIQTIQKAQKQYALADALDAFQSSTGPLALPMLADSKTTEKLNEKTNLLLKVRQEIKAASPETVNKLLTGEWGKKETLLSRVVDWPASEPGKFEILEALLNAGARAKVGDVDVLTNLKDQLADCKNYKGSAYNVLAIAAGRPTESQLDDMIKMIEASEAKAVTTVTQTAGAVVQTLPKP